MTKDIWMDIHWVKKTRGSARSTKVIFMPISKYIIYKYSHHLMQFKSMAKNLAFFFLKQKFQYFFSKMILVRLVASFETFVLLHNYKINNYASDVCVYIYRLLNGFYRLWFCSLIVALKCFSAALGQHMTVDKCPFYWVERLSETFDQQMYRKASSWTLWHYKYSVQLGHYVLTTPIFPTLLYICPKDQDI